MTIRLLRNINNVGVANDVVSLNAALEATLVSANNAVYVSGPDIGDSGVPVMGKTHPVTGRVTLSGAASADLLATIGPFAVPNAVGDGVADDSDAIIAAISTGQHVALVKGKTYLVSKPLGLSAGQHLYGNGATIKRATQTSTTTVTGVVSGVTNAIVVADSSIFSVGQQINIKNGANYGTQNVTVSGINGNTITTATSFVLSSGSPWSGETTVYLSFDTIKVADGCRIDGLVIDGNQANWAFAHWEVTSEIKVAGANVVISNCRINSAPGECIQELGPGLTGCQYVANKITNADGNGIHLSGSTGTLIEGNYIDTCNVDGVAVAHNGGCITLSNMVEDCRIVNNYLANSRAGVGQVDSVDNSRISIVGNTVVNMSSFMLELRGNNANLTDIEVCANRFWNASAPAAAALIAVDITDTGSGSISRVTVTGNQFRNAGLTVGRLVNAAITGNSFETTYQATDTYHDAIKATVLTDTAIVGNSTKYGNAGIVINGNLTDVVVNGNVCTKGYYYGIYAAGSTNINVMLSNNGVAMDNNVNTGSATGIVVGANCVARGNNVNMTAGYAGFRVNNVANAVVQGNTVRGAGAGKTIRVETGSTGYVVVDNQVSHAVTDTPAVGVRVANNDVIV